METYIKGGADRQGSSVCVLSYIYSAENNKDCFNDVQQGIQLLLRNMLKVVRIRCQGHEVNIFWCASDNQ